MKKPALVTAALTCLALPAHAGFILTFDSDSEYRMSNTVTNNDFINSGDIDTSLWSVFGADFNIGFDEDGQVDFYFMGSESGYNDSFLWDGGSYDETTPYSSAFLLPLAIGGHSVTAGTTAANYGWAFSNNRGLVANMYNIEFGAFMTASNFENREANSLLLAFDDNGAGPDDNHDDLLILASFTAAPVNVPEPGALTLLLSGVGLITLASRRRRKNRVAN